LLHQPSPFGLWLGEPKASEPENEGRRLPRRSLGEGGLLRGWHLRLGEPKASEPENEGRRLPRRSLGEGGLCHPSNNIRVNVAPVHRNSL
jgi:hypothetical protein